MLTYKNGRELKQYSCTYQTGWWFYSTRLFITNLLTVSQTLVGTWTRHLSLTLISIAVKMRCTAKAVAQKRLNFNPHYIHSDTSELWPSQLCGRLGWQQESMSYIIQISKLFCAWAMSTFALQLVKKRKMIHRWVYCLRNNYDFETRK